jgi:hypothetical protein
LLYTGPTKNILSRYLIFLFVYNLEDFQVGFLVSKMADFVRSILMGIFSIVMPFIQWSYAQWKKISRLFMQLQWRSMHLSGSILISSVLLVACSSPLAGGGNGAPNVQNTATTSQVPLSRLQWCGKPLMVFRDEGAATTTPVATQITTPATANSTPATIDDWQQVRSNLGFTVFLPATLPTGTCLMNASATIHDPIFGGNFTIGYLLPDHSALSFSEAPLRSQNTAFQCSPSSTSGATKQDASTKVAGSTKNTLLLCSGARTTTHVVFSALGTVTTLEQFFRNLQPDLAWIPA